MKREAKQTRPEDLEEQNGGNWVQALFFKNGKEEMWADGLAFPYEGNKEALVELPDGCQLWLDSRRYCHPFWATFTKLDNEQLQRAASCSKVAFFYSPDDLDTAKFLVVKSRFDAAYLQHRGFSHATQVSAETALQSSAPTYYVNLEFKADKATAWDLHYGAVKSAGFELQGSPKLYKFGQKRPEKVTYAQVALYENGQATVTDMQSGLTSFFQNADEAFNLARDLKVDYKEP